MNTRGYGLSDRLFEPDGDYQLLSVLGFDWRMWKRTLRRLPHCCP